MSSFDEELVATYKGRGLLTADGNPVHLPTQCPRASRCWADEQPSRQPAPGTLPAALSAPHVGPRYEAGRLLVLLENLYDYGGFDLRPNADVGMRYLARCAKAGLEKGQKVLFRGNGYAGTRVWHQAVSYAAAWLGALGRLDLRWNAPGNADGRSLAEALDLCALAQHVKCSPIGGRSHQSATMWSECGRHVLVDELRILRPRRLIVVGTGDNAHAVRTRVLPGESVTLSSERVPVGRKSIALVRERRLLEGIHLEVLVVPHPAMPGASSRALVEGVARVVATRAES